MSTVNELDLVLLGNTGCGKSSTGNSILRNDVFYTSYRTQTVTKTHPQYEWSRFEDCVLQVVDTPGAFDTSKCQDISRSRGAMEDTMITNPQGYHAFLLVIKYATRLTEPDEKVIQILKTIFGNDFLRNYGIIIMCNGDKFKMHAMKDGSNLETYCNKETGSFKRLLDECCNRIVLFDNVTKNKDERNQQIKNLIDMVNRLPNGGNRYSFEDFTKAEGKRKDVYNNSKLHMIEKETLKAQRLILDEIKNCYSEQDENKKIQLLEKIVVRTDAIIENLNENDQNSRALHDMLHNVTGIRKNVKKQIKLSHIILKDKHRLKVREENIVKEVEDVMNRMKWESEKHKPDEEKLKRDLSQIENQYRQIKAETDKEFFNRSEVDVVYVGSDAKFDEADGICFVSYFRISVALSLVALVVAIVAIAWIIYRHSYKNIFKTTITSADVVIYHQDKNTPKNYALLLGAHTVSALVRLFPAARFLGTDHKEDPIFNPTSHSILELNEQATDNIHQHATGVNITREGINIIYPGLYFVYSSVNFKPNSTRFSADFHYQTWFQYISRRSATSPVLSGVLLRTVHTCCSNCTGSQETAYTGAVFHLRTGDLIQMSVSGQGLIEFSAGASYLGLYMLHHDV
ncbi:uncharacterized protein LOC131944254 [Physella acuta]|uniref:uncharacterized protein LOC131944254 n=1 Tax=Physella acuta TaxID=109671 RepID=UPI0027DD3829|nr:uncharacterized protein LOC131944254 [Physella acuta]